MKNTLIAAMLGCLLGTFAYEPVESYDLPLVPLLLMSVGFFAAIYGITYFFGSLVASKPGFRFIGVFPGLVGGVNLSNISGALINDPAYSLLSPHFAVSLIFGLSIVCGALLALHKISAAQPNHSLQARRP